MIEDTRNETRETATIKRKIKKKEYRCKNPDCSYTNTNKSGPHICPLCGFIADLGWMNGT